MERLNIKAQAIGDSKPRKRKLKPVTLQTMAEWIKNKLQIEQEVKEVLLKEISGYPEGSLGYYVKNIRSHVLRIRDRLGAGKQDVVIPPPPEEEEE